MATTIRSIILVLAMLTGSAPSAFAYTYWVCGDDDKIEWEETPRMRASAIGFPDGHVRTAALQTVVSRWNNSPAAFRFNLTFNDNSSGLENGQNEIWFTNDADRLDGAPAAAFPEDDCGDFGFGDGNSELEEMDVVFACDTPWTSCADYPSPVDWYFGTNRSAMSAYSSEGERPFRTTAMHELGHALACRRCGGECREIGVMLLVLTPCLYCDVSDSWMLPNKWQRAFIGAAGMYVEIFLASIATFVWCLAATYLAPETHRGGLE